VRKQDGGKAAIIFGLVVLQPENFRRGEPRQDGIADGPDGFFETTEFGGELVAFSHGGGVTPKFSRADDFAFVIERDETMLLAADADGHDFRGVGLGGAQGLADGSGGGVSPRVRMLFLRAGREIGDQIVSSRARAKHLAGAGVHDERLGGLRAAINANQEISHAEIIMNQRRDASGVLSIPIHLRSFFTVTGCDWV
jgi:hypothetical protein